MILVDTSVWVDHLRMRDEDLAELLLGLGVASHPFVMGELACGYIQNRSGVLALMASLPLLEKVGDSEILHFIEVHGLIGRGLGLVDVHLLASCMLSDVGIWTRDRRLKEAALNLGLCADYPPRG